MNSGGSADFVDVVGVANNMKWCFVAQPVERAVSERAIQNISSSRNKVRAHDNHTPGGMNGKIKALNSTPPDAIVFRVCGSKIEVGVIGDLLVLKELPQLNQSLPPVQVRIAEPFHPIVRPPGDLVKVRKVVRGNGCI